MQTVVESQGGESHTLVLYTNKTCESDRREPSVLSFKENLSSVTNSCSVQCMVWKIIF